MFRERNKEDHGRVLSAAVRGCRENWEVGRSRFHAMFGKRSVGWRVSAISRFEGKLERMRFLGLLEFLFLAIRNFVCVGPLLSLYIFDDSYDLILDRESTRGRNLGKRKVEVVKDNACERGICLGNFLGRCLEFYVARIHENQDVSLTQTVKFGKIFSLGIR